MFKPIYYWITGQELKNEEEKQERKRTKQNKSPEKNTVKLVTKPGTDDTLRLHWYWFIKRFYSCILGCGIIVQQQPHDNSLMITAS